jgi:hypothetical protein
LALPYSTSIEYNAIRRGKRPLARPRPVLEQIRIVTSRLENVAAADADGEAVDPVVLTPPLLLLQRKPTPRHCHPQPLRRCAGSGGRRLKA